MPPLTPSESCAKYRCNTKLQRCEIDMAAGDFYNQTTCNSACGGFGDHYGCQISSRKCVRTGAGEFTSLESCKQTCSSGKPAHTKHPRRHKRECGCFSFLFFIYNNVHLDHFLVPTFIYNNVHLGHLLVPTPPTPPPTPPPPTPKYPTPYPPGPTPPPSPPQYRCASISPAQCKIYMGGDESYEQCNATCGKTLSKCSPVKDFAIKNESPLKIHVGSFLSAKAVQACCNLCTSFKGCKAFSANSTQCGLFTGSSGMVPQPGSTSGVAGGNSTSNDQL